MNLARYQQLQNQDLSFLSKKVEELEKQLKTNNKNVISIDLPQRTIEVGSSESNLTEIYRLIKIIKQDFFSVGEEEDNSVESYIG